MNCIYKLLTVTTILSLFFILGCNRKPARLYPYGWTCIDAEFDSLTERAERAFLEFQPDSVLENIINDMQIAAKNDPSTPEKLSRYHYWHARFRLRHAEIDESMEEFHVSLALTDSSRNPYDVARIRWNMELEDKEGAEGYFEALHKLEMFREFEDLPMQAAYYMDLGGIMNNVSDPASAIRYFNSADSLLKITRIESQEAGNMINRANSLERAGKTKEAVALLKNALNDPIIRKNKMAENIALWNLYLYTDSLPVLQQAYNGLKGDLDENEIRPLYGAHLIKEYAARNMLDSVAAMIPIVDADTCNLVDPAHWRDYYLGRAAGAKALGNYKEASEYYEKGSNLMRDIFDSGTAEEIRRIDQRRQIDEKTHQIEIDRKSRTMWLLVLLFVIIFIAGILIIVYRRRLRIQREGRLKASLAEEEAQRKVLALEIAMEENRRLGENIRETMDSLEKDGLVDPAASGTLEATLRSHDIGRPAREAFVDTFSQVNPRFLEALDKKYPNLSKTERRLAVYISLGLDNKHISRLTGVRPESVKQGRWRLRNKLGLPEDVSLEEEMRSLMEE